MAVGGDGTYDPRRPEIWRYIATAQRWMGDMRTNPYRKPQSWPQLRAKATSDYNFIRALFHEPRRRKHTSPY